MTRRQFFALALALSAPRDPELDRLIRSVNRTLRPVPDVLVCDPPWAEPAGEGRAPGPRARGAGRRAAAGRAEPRRLRAWS